MARYKCLISYDGTLYVGWQIQPTGTSIQELIEKAFSQFLGEKVSVTGASRTDSGVHALAQAAHFCTLKDFELRRFLLGVNTMLPKDIRVHAIERVSDDFHAQYSALSKLYHYHLYLSSEDDPFRRFYHYHIPFKISLSQLEEALQLFVGRHDFTSFANCGSSAKTFERTVYRMLLEEEGNNRFRIACEGNGFLYKMVRNMVGGALNVAKGKMSLDQLHEVLLWKDRRKGPAPAPARGLFLIKVNYPLKDSPISSNEEK